MSNQPNVIIGDIIESNQLPEPVKVVMVQPEGNGLRIMGPGADSNQFYDRVFEPGQFTVRRVTFASDGERFRLAAMAERIRAAAQFDPHLAIGMSQIDPLPHQIDAVYNYLLQSPRIRFLLADDPGAGKTIMAGLLLKELQYRGVVERTLVVAPANLTMQWQDEMRTRFGEDFTVIRSAQLKAHPGPAVWQHHPRAVISVDLARRKEVRETFEGIKWDLVIVDEAHKMAAYEYGGEIDKTQAYLLGEDLGDRCDHFLLMTATPHRGDPKNFRLLLSLLDRDLFATGDDLGAVLKQKNMPIFLRRLKEHMHNFDDQPLFPPRNVDTVRYTLAGKELELYEAVTEYVVERFQRAQQIANPQQQRNVALALMVLQRRLASSLRAIRKSLARREEKLKNQLSELQANPSVAAAPALVALSSIATLLDDEEPDDEVERWEEEEQALGVTVSPRTVRGFQDEIAEVHQLYELALAAEQEAELHDSERKLAELRRVLQNPLNDGKDIWQSGEKLLVFTENRDTLDYLNERFHAWGFRVAQIYGGMDQQTRREQQAYFKADDGAQIMVATEAAGEGINLQFCRLMVNYDIPWNPNRLEQRMGRIHRYGQRYSVQIFNLVAANTREGSVLDRVLDKLAHMRTDLGSDKVYDIIGDLLSATDLASLVQQALKDRQSLEDIQAAVERTVEANEQRRKSQTMLLDALAAEFMSRDALDDIREQVRTANEQRLVPEYIEQFVVRAFRALNHDKGFRADILPRKNDPGVWMLDTIPFYLRSAAPAGYRIPPAYPQVIFNKGLQEKYPQAQFVSPGHPFFEALLTLVRGNYGKLLTEGARFAASAADQGLFWLLEATVKDGTGAVAGQKLVGVRQALDGTFTEVDPLALLDVTPLEGTPDGTAVQTLSTPLQQLAAQPKAAEAWCKRDIVDPYLAVLQDQRLREANVQETYLERSLLTLIHAQEAKIMRNVADDKMRHKDTRAYDIGLRNLEAGLDEYKSRLQRRMELSAKQRAVGADAPRLIGVCAYIEAPIVGLGDDEDTDPDTEEVAVAKAMAYERANGRTPSSVESQNLGFDIRSRSSTEIRYIEVKGRKGTGPIMLTANEWIKAARFGSEYWLYVVFDCATPNPRLIVIHDPAAHLNVVENEFTSSHFRVNVGEVAKHGAQVNV